MSDINQKDELLRTCGFCFRVFTYDELPEGSVVFLGICACAECLERGVAAEFKILVDEEEKAYQKQYEGGIEWQERIF